MVQAGGCVPDSHVDIQVDYEFIKNYRAMMGSGGLVVMDERYLYGRYSKILYEFYTKRKLWKMYSLQRRHKEDVTRSLKK